jgi:hypothetical protein
LEGEDEFFDHKRYAAALKVERQVVPDGTIIPIAVQLINASDLSSKGR